ncbi:MAG: alginate export family protein [Planctomycetota bacterium]|nr:alginate export family protein [Planctomycetota bacterium]
MKIWLVILLLASHCQLLAAPLQADDPVSGEFPVGSRVEIDGRWDGQSLEAVKLVREEPDEFREIKGVIESIDIEANTILVGPFTILITEDTDFDDADDEDDSPELAQLQAGWRLHIEGVFDKPLHFRAFEVEVDTSPDPKKVGIIELEGFIEAEELDEDGVSIVVVNGIRCRIGPGTEIPGGVFRKSAQRRIQWDDRRPSTDIRLLDDRLGIGGRIKYEWEERDNQDLDDGVAANRTDQAWKASIEATWSIDRQRFFFAKGNWKSSNTTEQDELDINANEELALEEAYYFHQGINGRPLSVQIGRMDFDEGREWFYDTPLDAIRLEWEEGPYSVEASFSTLLGDPPFDVADRQNKMLVARWRQESRTHHALYIIDIIQDREFDPAISGPILNESPFFVGVQSHGRKMQGDLRYWFDGAYVSGIDGFDKISAFGIDASVARRFSDLPWTPYIFGGWAWGSGDDDLTDGTNKNFRQTGYEDNNSRYFGVASYRYLGVVMRPELSNLSIMTFGAGVRPVQNASIDLVFHTYNQVEASPSIRRSRLRTSPDGLHRDLGTELDLVFGMTEIWDDFDVEIELGRFQPGPAFAPDADPAWFTSLQLEYNF